MLSGRLERCGSPGARPRSCRISPRWCRLWIPFRRGPMAESRSATIYYKRARFLTHLPQARLYTKSHGWLLEVRPGVWRVGLTQFASRMLGDVVEFGFSVRGGETVAVGQSAGWIEGFKAVSDIYCVAAGEFLRANPA